jgi:hypothetical protein
MSHFFCVIQCAVLLNPVAGGTIAIVSSKTANTSPQIKATIPADRKTNRDQ